MPSFSQKLKFMELLARDLTLIPGVCGELRHKVRKTAKLVFVCGLCFQSQFSAPADICLGCNWNWFNSQNPRTLTGADSAGWRAGGSLAFKI